MTQTVTWEQKLVLSIAESVRHYRKQRGMSAEKLSEACEAVGYKIPRSVIANLESGRRETVSVTEWLVLGRALEVAPLLLIFPIGRKDLMEVLPGEQMAPWMALMWAEQGQWFPPAPSPLPWAHLLRDATPVRAARVSRERPTARGGPVDLFREHQDAVAKWNRMVNTDTVRDPNSDAAQAADAHANNIRHIRDKIRSLDLTPPDLPLGLEYLDEVGPSA